MVRLLLIVLIAYAVYRLAKKAFGPIIGAPRDQTAGGVIDEMVQDPQCKTYIPKREARRKVVGGAEHYFCSEECEEKFLAGAGDP